MTLPTKTDIEAPAAERRLVTVLFADVVDSTALAEVMDPEDWSGAIRSVLALISVPIERYGGTVARLMGDGLLALFGAPAAHEDDAIRAVQAGLEMVEAVDEQAPRLRREFGAQIGEGLRIRVGINTGLAIVEGMGDRARDVDALGDTVNVAARIQGAARPGTVLVTGNTWRFAAPSFRAGPLGGVVVKGKSEPVEAWEVMGRRDDPTSGRGIAGLTSRMVGRDDELAELMPLVAAVRAGRGRVAVVLGEPGVGKSRLLAEFRALCSPSATAAMPEGEATSTDLRWLEARCASYGENVPYGLLGDLVTACLGLPRAGTSAERMAALEQRTRLLFDAAHTDVFASLGHLLSLPLAEDVAQRFAPLSPEALRVRYLAAAEMTMRKVCSRGPIVIVVEDAHWADASSVEVVSLLLPIAHELPVLLVLTSRPERAVAGWALIEAARETFGEAITELPLSPLAAAESRVLIGNLLEIDSLPERLRTSILQRAEGNPFFVEELIRMLIERGWVVRSGDRWVGSGTVAEAEVPDTLRGLLLARLDRLPEDARRTLRMAAVIGRDVPIHLLEAVTGDSAATARALGLAEAAGLVRFAATEPHALYRFRHVLIQEAAYDSLLKADRRRLHRQVGDAMETLEPARREELAPILGLHFERAGEAERAVHYLHLAGRQALRRRALHEARELLDRAAAVLDDAPETPEMERRRIEVAIDRAAAGVTFVPLEQDLAILADARARAERLADDRLLGLALAREVGTRVLANSLYQLGPHRALMERAIEIGQRLADPEILALPRALEGLTLVGQGRRREAIPVLTEAVELLERFVVNEASFYAGQLATTYAELGDFETADRAVARASSLAELSGDPKALADGRIFRGIILALQGRFDEAVALATEAFDIAGSIGEPLCQTVASLVAGESELASGRTAPAIDWLEKSTTLAASCAAEEVGRMSTLALQAARAYAGEGPRALVGLDRMLEQIRATGDPLDEARLLLRRGEVNAMLDGGDRQSARADLEAAMAILRKLEAQPYLRDAERVYATLS